MAVCRADGIDVPLSGQKDSNLIHKNYACHFIVCSEDLAVQAIAIDVRTSLMQFLNLLFFLLLPIRWEKRAFWRDHKMNRKTEVPSLGKLFDPGVRIV